MGLGEIEIEEGVNSQALLDELDAIAALRLARRLYADAMHSALGHSATDMEVLLTLEQKIIETFYFEAGHRHVRNRQRHAYSRPTGIYIPGTDAGTAKAVAKRLRGHLMRQRFRPRFVDGELTRNDRFRTRYYYYVDEQETARET